MSKNESSSSSSGIGVLGLLGVLFVGLKLTGHINWSWWLVTLPFWGLIALLFAFAIIWLIVWVAMQIIEEVSRKKRVNQIDNNDN
jgi:hypothetical protein